ncbi:unnamed protein product [Pocillopora meandrina]|uniref:Uncharacterized protein n=1 Tax=Pocillopora meandrina TaxID=46732 RepID=A0AAU9VTM8_9CNID|nr:unnamed protein product [Pocillopora meandrina]
MVISWLRWFIRATILYGSVTHQEAIGNKTQTRDCLHVDPAGNKYNLTSLRNTDGTARFHITKDGWTYSFNPCVSFKIGKTSEFKECHWDVAICMWVAAQIGYNIGHQRTERCLFDEETKLPMIEYKGDSQIKTSSVLLKCNKAKERPDFEVRSVSNPSRFVFSLTHKCGCPNVCLFKPITPTEEPGLDNENWRIAAGGIGGLGIVIVICLIVRKLRGMNKPNPQVEEENRPILPDQENVNSFSSTSELSELTLGRASSLGRTSTGSSTNNDIKEIKEDPSDSKNKSNAKGRR